MFNDHHRVPDRHPVLRANFFSSASSAARYAAGLVRAVRLHGGLTAFASVEELTSGWAAEVGCEIPSGIEPTLRAHGRVALRVLGGGVPRSAIERQIAAHADHLEAFVDELARFRLLIAEDDLLRRHVVHAQPDGAATPGRARRVS